MLEKAKLSESYGRSEIEKSLFIDTDDPDKHFHRGAAALSDAEKIRSQAQNFSEQAKIRSQSAQVFAAVLGYDQLSATCIMAWAYAMHGYIPGKEAQERHENETKDKPDYYGTAEMLVNLYFPELLPDFLAIKTSSEKTRLFR